MDAYKLKRRDIFLGKNLKFGESSKNSFVRLAKKNAGLWDRPVHETWEIDGTIGSLNTPLLHHAGDSIATFVQKIDRYSTLNANYMYKNNVQSSGISILAYPVGKFCVNYVVKQGFRDGTHGFIHALIMSLHSFLTRSKLWLLHHGSSKH